MAEIRTVLVPVPRVQPTGMELDSSGIAHVWDTYIKPGQQKDTPQSVEERMLMAILRSVYAGLKRAESGEEDA